MLQSRTLIVLGALIAALAACGGDESTGPDGREGEGRLGEWVRSGGFNRTYVLRLPPSYDESEPAPLLLLFHGAGDTGLFFQKRIGLDSVADAAGFITVYPDGLEGAWFLEDVAFARTLITHLSEGLAVDPERIYAAGFSRGASLTHLLACSMSTELAGVASLGATMSQSIARSCRPVGGIPIVFVQGSEDPSFPWNGGIADQNVLLSMAQTVSTWTFLNSCPTQPEVTVLPDQEPDGTQVQIDRYSGCRDGSEVTLYAVLGGGHTWPGSPGPWPEFLGVTSREIDAGAEIIAFFNRH